MLHVCVCIRLDCLYNLARRFRSEPIRQPPCRQFEVRPRNSLYSLRTQRPTCAQLRNSPYFQFPDPDAAACAKYPALPNFTVGRVR